MLCISVGQILRGKNLKWRNKGFQYDPCPLCEISLANSALGRPLNISYNLNLSAHLIHSFFVVFPCHTELQTSAQSYCVWHSYKIYYKMDLL